MKFYEVKGEYTTWIYVIFEDLKHTLPSGNGHYYEAVGGQYASAEPLCINAEGLLEKGREVSMEEARVIKPKIVASTEVMLRKNEFHVGIFAKDIEVGMRVYGGYITRISEILEVFPRLDATGNMMLKYPDHSRHPSYTNLEICKPDKKYVRLVQR